MQKTQNNYAFIDAQNLYLGIRAEGWKMNYRKFRIYLKEKHAVQKAYMFMGYISANEKIYKFLERIGYILIFKPIIDGQEKIKGNCDAELVLKAATDFPFYDQAIIVTGDGDFYCLVEYLKSHEKLKTVISPSQKSCSRLLKMSAKSQIIFLTDLQKLLIL